jgi:ABC-type antimicrobial peptide transport system permease subunit
MKRSVIIPAQFCLCLITLLLAVVFGREFFLRYSLVYNEMGRYLDEENVVVYHEQALPFYGLSFVICLIALIILYRWTLKTVSKKESN